MKRANEYARRKEQRKQRREAGECTRCGVPLTEKEKAAGYLTCQRCRDKWRLDYYPNSTLALSRRPNADRGRNHDCWLCGAILPEGYTKKVCPECTEKRRRGILEYYRRKKEAKE